MLIKTSHWWNVKKIISWNFNVTMPTENIQHCICGTQLSLILLRKRFFRADIYYLGGMAEVILWKKKMGQEYYEPKQHTAQYILRIKQCLHYLILVLCAHAYIFHLLPLPFRRKWALSANYMLSRNTNSSLWNHRKLSQK